MEPFLEAIFLCPYDTLNMFTPTGARTFWRVLSYYISTHTTIEFHALALHAACCCFCFSCSVGASVADEVHDDPLEAEHFYHHGGCLRRYGRRLHGSTDRRSSGLWVRYQLFSSCLRRGINLLLEHGMLCWRG